MIRELEIIYENRRKKAEEEHNLFLRNLEEKIPEFKEIEKKITNKCAEIAREKVKGEDTVKLENELKTLKEIKKEILKKANVDESMLKVKYRCDKCCDTGYVSSENGRVKCTCYLKEEAKHMYEQSNMGVQLKNQTFNNFNLDIFSDEKIEIDGQITSQRENIIKIKNIAKLYIDRFGSENQKGLIFYGGVGLGKSFMCSCIGRALLEKGYTVLYYSTHDLIKIISQYTFQRDEFLKEHTLEDYNVLDKVDLMIIDDLGSEITNNFVKSEYFNIINSRINKNKATIISTNLNPADLEEIYGERLFSRFIMHFNLYEFIGEDVRLNL